MARMWSVAADVAVTDQNDDDLDDRRESLAAWARRTKENRIGLLELLDAVRMYKVAHRPVATRNRCAVMTGAVSSAIR